MEDGKLDMSELHEVSQAIGRLEATAENQGRLTSKLFDKLELMHKDVTETNKQHHDRLASLETCQNGVENDLKPAVATLGTKVDRLSENIAKSKIKALAIALGLTTTGGGAGAWFAKMFHLGS